MNSDKIYIPQLSSELVFPNPIAAPTNYPLAFGGDLSPARLLLAYKKGIFPWFSDDDPILWWSPDPRCLLKPDEFKTSKSLKKTLKANSFDVKFDANFFMTIKLCADIKCDKHGETWITDDMVDAYCELHELGYAHSVECHKDGELVGGLYGVSLGGAFFGESMFFKEKDASKVALYTLCQKVKEWDFDFIDAQVPTKHIESLGAKQIDRYTFLSMLNKSMQKETKKGNWGIMN